MTTIQRWTGRESLALRQALRLSQRDFAAQLGVSSRAIAKWEAGGTGKVPRPDSQAILDTELKKASSDAVARFEQLLGVRPAQAAPTATPEQPGARELALGGGSGYPRQIIHPVDGKLMALIDAGFFPSGPSGQPARLPAFYMDIYPTTNSDYAEFIEHGECKVPAHWQGGSFPENLGRHPVVNVTYRDAERYAEWAGKMLPSALEWEKAARGPAGDIYPWGNQHTPAKCNVRQSGIGNTTPVDRYHSGVSHYDIYDLAGNVWEWCRTETEPGRFTLKGSAFTSPLSMASGSAMNDAFATMLDDDTGFRCVATTESIKNL